MRAPYRLDLIKPACSWRSSHAETSTAIPELSPIHQGQRVGTGQLAMARNFRPGLSHKCILDMIVEKQGSITYTVQSGDMWSIKIHLRNKRRKNEVQTQTWRHLLTLFQPRWVISQKQSQRILHTAPLQIRLHLNMPLTFCHPLDSDRLIKISSLFKWFKGGMLWSTHAH